MAPILVASIGNPGSNYEYTRHNIGHRVIDSLLDGNTLLSVHKKSGTMHTTACYAGNTVHIAKTTCFMNESGKQIAPLANYFAIAPENILIIHDDLDLPFGTIRLKKGGSEGGHNGLKSISSYLSTKDYCRLRVGISHPGNTDDIVDYVLGKFSVSEEKQLPTILTVAHGAVEQLAEHGFTFAQNRVNSL